MLRPLAIPQTRKKFTPARIAALAGAGVIEVALVAAMLSGLGAKIVKEIPKTLNFVDVVQQEPPKPEPIPVPEPEMVQPTAPTVALPDIKIARPARHAITSVAVPKPVVSPRIVAPKPVPVPQTPVAIPETHLQSVMATHTTPPYPTISLRMGEQGRVQLHIIVDANGNVTSVTVARSSGHSRLDEAAVDWVKTHWRYRAATRNGQGIPSATDAIVVFDLKTAR